MQHPAQMRPGDWICPQCNNHNYADKVRCNKCAVPKAVQSQAHRGASGPITSQPGMPVGTALTFRWKYL